MMKLKQYAMPADKLAYRIKKTGITHVLVNVGTAAKWGDEPACIDGCMAVRATTMSPEIATMSKCDASNDRFKVSNIPTQHAMANLGCKDVSDIKPGEYEYLEVMFYDTKLLFDYASGDIFTYVSEKPANILPKLFVVTGCASTKNTLPLMCMDLATLQGFQVEGIGLSLLLLQKKALKLYGATREPQKGVKEFSRRVLSLTYGELFAWAEEHNAKAEAAAAAEKK